VKNCSVPKQKSISSQLHDYLELSDTAFWILFDKLIRPTFSWLLSHSDVFL